MCFKDIWKVKSARKAQPVQAQGLSFLAVSEKEIAFSEPVTMYSFQTYADEQLRISNWNTFRTSCSDHSEAVPEIPKSVPCSSQAVGVTWLYVSRILDLHLAIGTATERVTGEAQSGRLPRVNSLTVEL